MTDAHVLSMPIRRFWLFSGCIDRLAAAEDMRALGVSTAINTKESIEAKVSELTESIGTIVVKNVKRDRESVKSLKARLSM